MSFAVEPEALVKFAALVERNGINLSLSNVHLSSETTLGNTDGLWLQHLVDAHVPTVDRMSSSLFRAFHVMGDSADEFSRTAKHYRDADQAAEANLDTTYPASATWSWVLANAFVLAAAVLLVSALSSPLLAGAVTLVLWFAAAVVANLAPAVWLPLAYFRDQDTSWDVAAGLVVVAVGVHVRTCGMTGRAHRQFER